MAHFHNQSAVGSQINSQHVQGNIINNHHYPSDTSTHPAYDLGVRFGQAPQIDQDYFVGRDHELEQLGNWLTPASGKQNVVVLHGMGGIGKTQLSIQHVRQTSTKYTSVFWLNAKDEKTLRAGLVNLAIDAVEPNAVATDAQEEERLIRQAQQWLSRSENNQWLLIYDNYDDPRVPGVNSPTAYDVRIYFPPRAHGSILVTTRSPRCKFGRQLHLTKLEDEGQNLSILAARSGRPVKGDPAALKLAQRLDGLPLALATAGTYLRHSADSFEDYLDLYNNSWNELQWNDHGPEDYEERTLYSTWNISFQQIQQQDAAAAQLLALIAYFNNQDLWYELFYSGRTFENAPSWWTEVTQSRPRFQRAMSMLHNYSLLEAYPGGYSLHPCVHDWTLEHLNRVNDPCRFQIAVHSIAQSVHRDTHKDYWIHNRRLLPHAHRIVSCQFRDVTLERLIIPQDQCYLGYLYMKNGMYEEAEDTYNKALAESEKSLGAEHFSTLTIVHDLGSLFSYKDKLAEAEKMYIRALAGREKVLGPEHALTLDTVHGLGRLLLDQSKLREAETMYLRALAGKEKTCGPEHISTLITVDNIGLLFAEQGRMTEAEEMYQRALSGNEKVLGPEHTSTLKTINHFANLYAERGKLKEAERMYIRALHGFEKARGPEHRWTLETVNNLGLVYAEQGKMDQAEGMYQRALSGIEKALGPDHTSTLQSVHNLGLLYMNQGKLVEAEQMYLRALSGYRKTVGPDNSLTLNTSNGLGLVYAKQGKLVQAEQMYDQALAGFERVLGPEHVWTLNVAHNLGLLYETQGKPQESEDMFQRVATTRQKVLGSDHPATKFVLDSLEKLSLKRTSESG